MTFILKTGTNKTKVDSVALKALLASVNLKTMEMEKRSVAVKAAGPLYRMPPIKDLEKRWGEFKTHFALYEAAYEAYRYIGRLLTAKEFTNSQSSFYNEKGTQNTTDLLKALNAKDNDYYFMDVGPKNIQTKLSFYDIKLSLNMANDQQSLMDGETILRALFPDYKAPTKWEKKTIEKTYPGNAGTYQDTEYSIGEDLVNTIPLKKFVDIKPRFTPTNTKTKSEDLKFSLPKKYMDNNFDNIASIKLTLKQSNVRPAIGSNAVYTTATEGTLIDGSFRPTMEVEIEAVFNWPVEFAYYVTCANGPGDFIPFLFFQYLSWHKSVYSGGRTRGGGFGTRPSRINHLGNILERNTKEQQSGRIVKNRTNSDGFLTLGVGESSQTGEVYWIPSNVNKINDYVSQIKGSYNAQDKRVDLSQIKLKGEGLYTDWYNEKYAYIREDGVRANSADISGIQTLDLTGSTPLDNITIYLNMDKPLSLDDKGDLEWYLSIVRKFLQGDMRSKGALPSKQYGSSEYLASIGVNVAKVADKGNLKDYINGVIYSYSNHGLKFGWANIGGQPMIMKPLSADDVLETKDPDKFKDIRGCFNLIKDVSSDLLSQIDKLDGVSHSHIIGKLRYILYMITNYSSKYTAFKTQHDDAITSNLIVPISDTTYRAALNNIVLPNLTGITKFMPHQLETNIQMSPPPEAALTEISAGGGKTIIQLAEIAKLLLEGDINRSIVVVPGNLVRNWINEITEFSKGQINVFALNINTLRRMQYVYNQNPDPVQKPDYKMLKSIIQGLPKNTIIVTSYRFLSNDRERIVYGNKIIQRYYIAEFLRDIGFDLVALDESHTAKNLKSNSTTAVAILLSAAKFKRELSGTAVFDNVGDLVGQAGIMIPPALGSFSQFQENFAESGEWDMDAPTRITDAMRPYIKRITHKRQKWAAMLPQLIEQFAVVNMTPRQTEFYNGILESKIEELRSANPKLFAKLLDSNDKDAKAIESGLATYFQAVEQFIYAPDSNEAFTQLDNLEPEDLISPKVAKVVEILDQHFKGYTDDRKRTHGPDNHKVIIFSHRTKTSEHMMRHLPANYQKIAIRYVAGDYQALQQFLTNDKIRILVADELSINTGQNLQLASRMIRLETLWSPGGQEQAIARIWRPAFKEGSDRQKVFMNWIYTNHTLEVTKIGRLISKIITKTRYDQQDNPTFVKDKFTAPTDFTNTFGGAIPSLKNNISVNDMLNELPLLRMNIKTLTTKNDSRILNEYFANYALINLWEDREFERLKSEERYTKTVTIPKSAYKVIPNSAIAPYTPRVPGVKPDVFDPADTMGYRPISIVEEQTNNVGDDDSEGDDDDNEEIEVEVNPVIIGTIVDTEFGFGRVTKLLQKEVWVEIAGAGEVKVPKTTAWVITNKEQEARIERLLVQGDPRANLRLPPEIVNILGKNRIKPLKPTTIEYEEEEVDHDANIKAKPAPVKHEPVDEYDEEDEEEIQLPIWASIVDTQIALNTAYEAETEFLVEDHGWHLVGAYSSIQVPNAAALDKIIAKLQSKYTVRSEYIRNLDYYRTMLQNKSLDVAQPNMVNQTMRFFGQEEHKKLNATSLRPFPIIWDNHLYIAFDKQNTPALTKAISDIKALGIASLHVIQQPSMAIKFYQNKESALEDLNKFNKQMRNPHLADATKTLQSVKTKKNTVVLPAKTSIIPRLNLGVKQEQPIVKIAVKPDAKNPPKTNNVLPKVNTVLSPQTNKPVFKLNLGKLGKLK